MLVDVVMFSGENDLLAARLDILKPDVCVVVESDRYFQGQPKRLLYDLDAKNVTYLVHMGGQSPDPWQNEYAMRRAGLELLDNLDIPGDAVVGLFDVDEIPDPQVIRETGELTAWNMAKHQMSVYWYQRHEVTGLSALYSQVAGRDAATLRLNRYQVPVITGGWHFSSMLDVDGLLAKWEGFSHTEFRRPNMREWVEHCVAHGLALESGDVLEEQDQPVVPERMFAGPECWLRKRV